MTARIELLDTVAVIADIPSLDLTAGEVGAVVEIFGKGEAFEVEFCDDDWNTCTKRKRVNLFSALERQGRSSHARLGNVLFRLFSHLNAGSCFLIHPWPSDASLIGVNSGRERSRWSLLSRPRSAIRHRDRSGREDDGDSRDHPRRFLTLGMKSQPDPIRARSFEMD